MQMTIEFLTDFCNENSKVDMTNKKVVGYEIYEFSNGIVRINFNDNNGYFFTDTVELISFCYMKSKKEIAN